MINLLPFEVELDRTDFGLRRGSILRAEISRRQKIALGEITSLRVHGSMTDGQADGIGWSLARNNLVSLENHMDFNCALNSFSKTIYNLEGICPRVINASALGQR